MGDSCVERIQALGRERHGDDWEAHWEAHRLVQGSGQRAAGSGHGSGRRKRQRGCGCRKHVRRARTASAK
jgi:hypothetical protein